MRVLQINSLSRIQSTGRICAEISDYLNANGGEGYIAYADGIPYEYGYKIGNIFDIKVHALLSRIFGTQAYFSKHSTKRLLNYIETLKPDIIHLHNLHANYINLKLLLEYLALKDIPTVITLHDCWFFTGKCTHYTLDNCFRWKTECYDCPRLKKDNKSWFFDRTSKMHKDKKDWFGLIPRLAVVGVSEWITNEAKKSILSSAQIITKIYNWVDFDIFKPVNPNNILHTLGIRNKFVILGVATNWSNTKGLDKFIELSTKIEVDTVIVLIGRLKHTKKLPENIIHINETHNKYDLATYYSMADIFINFSLEETFGIVTAEALACGTPVIVMNSTANPELVGDRCGYITESCNIDEIINKINEVKHFGKNYYSQYCINFAKENFDIQKRIKDYIATYKKVSERV